MERTSEILNDLLKINNDRIAGYEKAIKETNDGDLKDLFTRMIEESRLIANTLTQMIVNRGEEPAVDSTTNPGKIYRVWMDIKATFSGKDRESVLNACEFGEDAAQTAYKSAIESNELPADVLATVTQQKSILRASHDLIKEKRDQTKAEVA